MKKIKKLTESEKANIEEMFFGPYKDKWKVNGQVDNRDSTIAKRLKLPLPAVCKYTDKISREHFENLPNYLKHEKNKI